MTQAGEPTEPIESVSENETEADEPSAAEKVKKVAAETTTAVKSAAEKAKDTVVDGAVNAFDKMIDAIDNLGSDRK